MNFPVFPGKIKKRSMRKIPLGLLILLTVWGSSCTRAGVYPGGNIQTGIASWYGSDFHGRPTSSREIYDMNDMTAAHQTLPFGTHVMVTNLDNGLSCVVRINDRGPFVKNRIIDLSYAAAQVIDMVGPGTARVRIEVLRHLSPRPSAARFSVQVGSFTSRKNAEAVRKKLSRSYRRVVISRYETPNQVYYRVRIRARDRNDAARLSQRLADSGYTVLVLEEW